MSATDLSTAARKLRELVESEAELVEEKSTMTPPVVDALVDSGLFRLLVPRAFGGFEADPATIIDVCAELSYADGSVGWAFAQNTTVMAYAAYLEPRYAEPLSRARAGAGTALPESFPSWSTIHWIRPALPSLWNTSWTRGRGKSRASAILRGRAGFFPS